MVRVLNDYLVLETLHFPDEVRNTIDLPKTTDVKLTKQGEGDCALFDRTINSRILLRKIFPKNIMMNIGNV